MATEYSNMASTDDLLYQNFGVGATNLPSRDTLSSSPDGSRSNDSFRRNGSGSDSGEPISPRTSGLFDPEAELEMHGHVQDEVDDSSTYYDAQEYLTPKEQFDDSWKSKYEVQYSGDEVYPAETASASPSTSKPSAHKPKLSKPFHHHFDKELSQSKRRKQMLEYQKTRRDHMLDKIRQLDDGESGFSESETEDGFDFLQIQNNEAKQEPESQEVEMKSESKKKPKKKRAFRRAPACLMLSEWLITQPEDFIEKWIGVLCPAGKRALVVASRGRTKVYSLREEPMGNFVSMLPGGRKVHGIRSRGVTILDCVWSEMAQVFYVLDLICWNSHSCVNCDMEYRLFFLASKFAENQDLLTTSAFNHIPFMPLPYFKSEDLPTILTSTYPPFPDPIDGIIFIHKESFYISEINPLCLWLRLADVDRRLGLTVNPELLEKEAPPKIRRNKNAKQANNMDCDFETSATATE